MSDLYHGEYPVDLTPNEARALCERMEAQAKATEEAQRRIMNSMTNPQEQIISDELEKAMTDKLNVERLRALDEAATPGPWEAIEVRGHANFSQLVARLPDGLKCVSTDIDDAEGALTAYLRNAVPSILAMAEENARWSEAVFTIMARCEALEDEAADELAKEQEEHAKGFWRGQKLTAKSLRRHLHDLSRPAVESESADRGAERERNT